VGDDERGETLMVEADAERTPTPTYTVKIVCAWCGKHMRTEQWDWDAGISHGMCKTCQERMEESYGLRKEAGTVRDR